MLREIAYPDGTNLAARSSIYAFQQPRVDLHGWVLGLTDWPAGSRVLDVGCGPGAYLARLAATAPATVRAGFDLSEGMIGEARAKAGAAVAVADVGRLPVPDAAFDRILAMHMLYHAPDLEAAVRELRRVLKPGGVLLALTNGDRHLDGFARLVERASGVPHWLRFFQRFSLENGESWLGRAFDDIERLDVAAELAVTEVEPVVRYVVSCRSSLEEQLPPGLGWDDAIARVREEAQREIDATGAFRSGTRSGVFVCR